MDLTWIKQYRIRLRKRRTMSRIERRFREKRLGYAPLWRAPPGRC